MSPNSSDRRDWVFEILVGLYYLVPVIFQIAMLYGVYDQVGFKGIAFYLCSQIDLQRVLRIRTRWS